MDSTVKIIGSIPLFDGLDSNYIKAIASIAQKKSCKKGEIIFNEGDKCNGFYVIESGTVKIFKTSFGGKEQILHIYNSGKPFGEVPVFTGKNFPASAISISSADLIFFPRKAFVSLITENPSLALNMLAVLSMRLHQFTIMVENLALKDVPARLASYLLILLKEQNQKKIVTLPVSKNQLAGLLGTTPETISRVFAKFSNDLTIEVDRNEITILNIDKLADAAQQ
ncbi:MAG: Crp/Fnr family transcriptional regulator [Desulfamplus sp.]|nr:Crp/Fnr family transcriptional regulator [Desulfamplus sp.]MBF0390381.1 Crp/Fnr family transcriptional regulator [Desulfamplus sp.]